MKFYGDEYTEEESVILNSIMNKILPAMNIPSGHLVKYDFNLSDQKMIDSMINDIITNFWIEK